LREEQSAVSVFLELGQRPDEPGPPVHGRAHYPAEVVERLQADAARIVARYPVARSALLPLLHLVQAEDGCLTPAGISFCADLLGLTDAEVTAVATFYSMYRRTPTGEYLVGVCTNTLCAVMGGDAILDTLENHLGIHAGQTTPDGSVTLEHVECNAACDYAPVVMVNWEFFDNQTPTSARDLVDALREGRPPETTRGGTPCTFQQTARILAGVDVGPGAADAGRVGEATLAGLRVARERGLSAPEPGAVATDSGGGAPDGEQAAEQAAKDEPAPAPSADVPAGTNGAETP
jgi:NADH-quinone oxidoreductase subunit E